MSDRNTAASCVACAEYGTTGKVSMHIRRRLRLRGHAPSWRSSPGGRRPTASSKMGSHCWSSLARRCPTRSSTGRRPGPTARWRSVLLLRLGSAAHGSRGVPSERLSVTEAAAELRAIRDVCARSSREFRLVKSRVGLGGPSRTMVPCLMTDAMLHLIGPRACSAGGRRSGR